jgi:hypothetical protein
VTHLLVLLSAVVGVLLSVCCGVLLLSALLCRPPGYRHEAAAGSWPTQQGMAEPISDLESHTEPFTPQQQPTHTNPHLKHCGHAGSGRASIHLCQLLRGDHAGGLWACSTMGCRYSTLLVYRTMLVYIQHIAHCTLPTHCGCIAHCGFTAHCGCAASWVLQHNCKDLLGAGFLKAQCWGAAVLPPCMPSRLCDPHVSTACSLLVALRQNFVLCHMGLARDLRWCSSLI